MKWYIGVDPGLQGGLGLIDGGGRAVEYGRMPDITSIDRFFRNAVIASGGRLAVVYEEHKGGGPDTNANVHKSAGRFIGIFETLCCIHGVPMHKITPQVWKAELQLIQRAEKRPKDAPKLSKAEKHKLLLETRKKAKAASCQRARELFPGINLGFPRCTTEHDGVAESLLTAEFGRRKRL